MGVFLAFKPFTCCGYLRSVSLLVFSTPLSPEGNALILVQSSILAECPSGPDSAVKRDVYVR